MRNFRGRKKIPKERGIKTIKLNSRNKTKHSNREDKVNGLGSWLKSQRFPNYDFFLKSNYIGHLDVTKA